MSGLLPPNVLSYEGQVVVPFINRTTDPTTSNFQFNVPTIWINTAAERGYILLGKPMNVAAWQSFAGSTVVTETLTGNSGGAVSPTGNNINVIGAGSITTVGNPGTSTLTVQLTGLTNHAVQVGSATTTLTQVGPSATAGQVLQSGGSSADPAFSTATYPATTTVNQILYSSATNVVSGLSTVNNGVLITGTTGIPSLLPNGTTGQVLTATTGAAPSWASIALSAFDRIATQVFTSSGTYTPTTGMKYCIIEVVGGGGGGGATTATGAGEISAGSGGGGGGYARKTVSAATIGASQTVTIGAAGAAGAVSGGNGGAGGTTSVGAIISATGGQGGLGASNSAVVAQSAGLAGAGSGGDFNTVGNSGSCSFGLGVLSVGYGGFGGSSFFGGGGRTSSGTAGTAIGTSGTSYGGGGGGGITFASSAAVAGGDGFAGIVIITEFLSV